MTTITIDEDIENLPSRFESWNDLQEFALNKLRVQIRPLAEEEIDDQLLKKVAASRQKLKSTPKSFDDLR